MKTLCLSLLLAVCAAPFANADDVVTNAPVHTKPVVVIAPGTPATPPTDPAKFELFLLVGQSNMAGRAPLTEEDKVADPRVLVLDKDDKWVTRGEPIHYDKPAAVGVGPGYTFAKLMADKEPGVTIGVIPCAFGGTGIDQWNPTSKDAKLYPPDNLYNNAIRRAKIAMQSGTLKGILWHQGESDSGKFAGTYAARLQKLIESFRTDLSAPDMPFIAGELGYYNYLTHPPSKTINEQIHSLTPLVPHFAIVSADGLVDKGDHLHFDNASQKELAKRYVDAYLQLEGSPAPAKP